jgi:hypothetical protein
MINGRYVPTSIVREAVRGHEIQILHGIGVDWPPGRGASHIHCPDPGHPDKNPSWRLLDNGAAVCSCRKPHSVFDVIGYVKGLDFESSKILVAELLGRPDIIVHRTAETATGLTLAQYAQAKRLPIDWLRQLGLRNGIYKGVPAVRIPYFNEHRHLQTVQYRVALTGNNKQFFKKGTTVCLYGAHHTAHLHEEGYAVIAEGASDVETLWHHGIPAFGLSGAGSWNEERDAHLFDGAPIIFVIIEPDEGGERTIKWLSRSSIVSRVRLIRFPKETKDPSALFLSDPENFPPKFKAMLDSAEPFQADETQQPPRNPHEKGDALSKIIEEFNGKYAVVNEAGAAVVYESKVDPILNRKILVRITFENLKKFYQNRLVTVQTPHGSTTKSAAVWWLDDPRRRQYLDGVVFDPAGNAPSTCWNLWSGFSVEPKEGDWNLMRDHIHRVICSGDNAHKEYLLDWTARMFQKPHRQGEVAIVIRGAKGVGKGIFFQYLRMAWGQHGAYISNAKHLVGNFNGHLRDCVMLFADEAFFAGDRQHESVLKAIVTEPTLPIEAKHQNLINVMNMLHIGMASNSDWVVPASHDERRYFVLNASDHRVGQRNYFAKIIAQMDNGGLAAMIFDMLHRDISSFEVRDVPDTPEMAEQKKHSLDSLDRWWLAILERGFVWRSRHGISEFGEWHEFCSTELLSRSYLQWCGENRIQRPMTRVQLGIRLNAIHKPFRPDSNEIIGEVEAATKTEVGLNKIGFIAGDLIIKSARPRGYTVEDLDQARARFAEIRGIAGDWTTS